MADKMVARFESREPSVEELRDRVSNRFRSVGAAAGALRARVRDATDVRSVARRHPTWVLVAAAGAGVVAAGLVRRGRRHRSERVAQATLEWLAHLPGGRRPTGVLGGAGNRVVRGAMSVLAGVLVRRFTRRLREDIRPRPRLITPTRARA
jgi:hypothetical protein